MALSCVIGWSVGGAVAVLVSALARPAVVISISVRTVSSVGIVKIVSSVDPVKRVSSVDPARTVS